jgi:predicted permease
LKSGLPEHTASRRARLAFGGVDQVMEECRASRGISTLTAISQDIRYGIRVLRKSPAFTAVAIISLTLGIGVNTVAFSVVNALILRPLPFPEPDRLVSVHPIPGATTSFPNYRALRDMNNVFRDLAAYRITVVGLETGGTSQRVWAYLATGNYFQTLGATPFLGRFFGPDDDRYRGGSAYAVLSYRCWRNRFGGDPAIIGRKVRLNGLMYTVLGVAGKSFQGTEIFYWPEIWVPMSMQAQIEGFPWLDEPATFNSMMVGRLKGGITKEKAEAQLQPIAAALAKENPRWNDGLRFKLSPLGLMGDTFRGPVIGFTAGVLALAGLVLLAACANLACLLAARTSDRHKELAIRISLGAGRGRIARQLMTESILVAIAGGLAASAASVVLLKLLSQWHAPLDFPVQFNVEPDWRVFRVRHFVQIPTRL